MIELAQVVPPAGASLGWPEFGVLGLLVLAFLTGQVVPGYMYKRIEKENDRLRALIDDKIYPLVSEATKTQDDANDVMQDLYAVLSDEQRRDAPPLPSPSRRRSGT